MSRPPKIPPKYRFEPDMFPPPLPPPSFQPRQPPGPPPTFQPRQPPGPPPTFQPRQPPPPFNPSLPSGSPPKSRQPPEQYPMFPPKSRNQIFEESQRFINSSIDKKYISFFTADGPPESQYPQYQNIEGKDLGDYEDIRKNISFGTDIIGIILNPKLLKSDNIFEDPEILKYRMFSSYKNMYNYITKNTENIKDIGYDENIDEDEYYKNKILDLYKRDDKATKTKKLMEVSKSYDDNFCSILSCDDGISCMPIIIINDLLNYYGKNFDVSRQETDISFKRKKSLALYNSTHNFDEIDDEKTFYKYLYTILKNNVDRNFDSKKISKTIQDNKQILDNLFLYYKPLCLYEKHNNPTIIEINHCMRQYEHLINNSIEFKYDQENLFYFHGCYELKDDDYGKPEFMVDFEQLKSQGRRFIGYIFVCPFAYSNIPPDLYYQYITLYIDIKPDDDKGGKQYIVYYFEPSKFPERTSITKFLYYLCMYNKIQPKELNLISNKKPNSDRFIYLNNAIYAIIALIALAYDIDFQKFCDLPIYDKFLNQIKQIMFIDKSRYINE